MSDESKKFKVAPLFLIPQASISPRDIRRIEKMTGICIVECKEPSAVRLLDPPIDAEIDLQSRAALRLFRYIVQVGQSTSNFNKADLLKMFVDYLIQASEPKQVERVKK